MPPSTDLTGAARPSIAARFLGHVIDWCVGLAVFLVPLWFLPVTLDVLELNKQTLLIAFALIGLVAWLGKAVVEKRLVLSRSWMHLVVLVFLAGYLVTSLFSEDRYLSFVGNFGQMQWSFVTLAAFVVTYFLIVNTVRRRSKLYNLLLAFLASSSIVALFGLLQMLGIHVLAGLLPVSADKGFNTVGSINSLAVFLAVPIVVAASLLVLGCRDERCILAKRGAGSTAANMLVWFTLVVSLVVAVLANFWVVWVAVLFGSALLIAIPLLRARSTKPPSVIVPGLLAAVSVILLIWSIPLKLELPSEVSPSMSYSWEVARQTLQDKPLFGSGPGTWIYDYSQYRIPAVNLSPFWTVRFERGMSTFLTLLAMTGIVGISLWLLVVLSAILKSATHLVRERDDDAWQAYLTVFTGWATAAFTAFFYNYNVSHHFVFWLLLALLVSLVARDSFVFDGTKRPATNAILSLLFLVCAVSAVSAGWIAGQRLWADANYSAAVAAFRNGKPIQEAIDGLNAAVALNRLNDTYDRNLSQAYLVRLNQELQAQPTPDQVRLMNSLVGSAVDAAKRATELSPANVDNWSNLAVIYQSIASFTRGADEFAIANFQEALKREPTNPAFYNEIGKLFILRSDAIRTLLSSKDETVRADAVARSKAELDKAAEALNQAILVKADYAPAHYGLGILYERENRLKDAIAKLEQVLAANNKDVGVGFQLAVLYERNGDKDKAMNLFEQIVALQPSYANARWYLAALYEERGRLDDAIAQLKQIQATNPGNQLVADQLLRLINQRDEKSKPTVQPIPEPIKEEITGPAPLNAVKKP